MIEDPRKAEAMAYAEKKSRDLARDKVMPISDEQRARLDQIAEMQGERVGKEYDQQNPDGSKDKVKETKETDQDLEKFRKRVENIIAEGKRLVHILRIREEDEMSALIEPEELPRLNGSLTQLEEAAHAKKRDEIESALDTIRNVLREMGRAGRSRVLREDSESLTRVMYALRGLGEAVRDAKFPELSDELKGKLNGIHSIVEDSWHFVAKRRELIKNYEDRRY